jgi:hypothetical protein
MLFLLFQLFLEGRQVLIKVIPAARVDVLQSLTREEERGGS